MATNFSPSSGSLCFKQIPKYQPVERYRAIMALLFYFVYNVASANIDQSVPNLATIHMPIRSRMSSIMGQIEPEHLKLFALERGKIAENDFVYTLSSTNLNQSAPNLIKVYMTMRSRMSLILEIIGPELSKLSALELENLPYLTLFTL